ncbi:hypothetical protein [Dendronalium sp. ChiSLP03b]|uniref:hypothetical protein n=1 Tax=Dendronalium sp. ChiSLP03b TaxID=3075381 RepID=UPI002AD5961B|nr:hypothetical protein [Dendronalium sp. ChiSLP03b]MDZ8208127.1 hypothetical protein [Dendronalium sp. ChiSLP03b]
MAVLTLVCGKPLCVYGNAKSEQVGFADGSYFNGGNLTPVLSSRQSLDTRSRSVSPWEKTRASLR